MTTGGGRESGLRLTASEAERIRGAAKDLLHAMMLSDQDAERVLALVDDDALAAIYTVGTVDATFDALRLHE